MTRRAQHEGNIRRRADGRWEGRVHVGYSAGRRVRKSFYGTTRRVVQEKMVVAQRNLQQGVPPANDRVTLAAFAERWLATVRPQLRPTTLTRYEELLRIHILPSLGRMAITRIQPDHVQAVLNEKFATGLSPQTVGHIRAVLRTMLAHAVKWGILSRNVAALADPPRMARRQVRAVSPEEARQILAAVRGDRLETLFLVALAVGVRQGEALGLRWADLNLDDGLLTVRQALQRVAGTFVFVEPKSSTSRRSLILPPTVTASLRSHRTRQLAERLRAGDMWHDLDLVFGSAFGLPLNGADVTKKFQQLLLRAGLRRLRFHDLRHACASLLLAQGVPARVVMETLGHSTITLTMNTYSHVIPELMHEAADRMDGVLTAEA